MSGSVRTQGVLNGFQTIFEHDRIFHGVGLTAAWVTGMSISIDLDFQVLAWANRNRANALLTHWPDKTSDLFLQIQIYRPAIVSGRFNLYVCPPSLVSRTILAG
jgi:hypothetical protein